MKVMMNIEIFFCDTYALIELIRGNKDYKKYINCALITSDLNIMEMYYSFLIDCNKEIADKYFDIWSGFVVQIPREIIKKAMQIKLDYKSEKLSYVDCMGYTFAMENNVAFLTGDEKFKDKNNVEFVK